MFSKIKMIGLGLFLIGNAVCSTLFAVDSCIQLPPLNCAYGYYSYQTQGKQGCTKTCPSGTVVTSAGFQCIPILSGGLCTKGYTFVGVSAKEQCVKSDLIHITPAKPAPLPACPVFTKRCGLTCTTTCTAELKRAGTPCTGTAANNSAALTTSASLWNATGTACTNTVSSDMDQVPGYSSSSTTDTINDVIQVATNVPMVETVFSKIKEMHQYRLTGDRLIKMKKGADEDGIEMKTKTTGDGDGDEIDDGLGDLGSELESTGEGAAGALEGAGEVATAAAGGAVEAGTDVALTGLAAAGATLASFDSTALIATITTALATAGITGTSATVLASVGTFVAATAVGISSTVVEILTILGAICLGL